MPNAAFRIVLFTTIAMVAFAANSVLARLALIDGAIGPWSYTLLRLASGAVVLAALVGLRAGPAALRAGSWAGAVSLLAYAGLFSLAYLALGAGLGALILFAFVQLTMLGWGLKSGERLGLVQMAGLAVALAALVWLLSPGLSGAGSPLWAIAAMALSGIAWGIYSLLGRGARQPTAMTAGNFWRASVIALPLSLPVFLLLPEAPPSPTGIVYALLSGTLASGLGYAIWYTALPGLKATQAGIAQLSVPAIAAAGGVLFLAEPLTLRFILSTALILGGVALATLPQNRRAR